MSTNLRFIAPENDRGVAPVLTCWKDIARYVGKGVRTVQRWEQELGFPVRRTERRQKGRVLAVPTEIDSWVKSQQCIDGQLDAHGSLLRSLHELRIENRELRSENRALLRQLSRQPKLATVGGDVLLKR
jgi:erythromycin esterase-like protein